MKSTLNIKIPFLVYVLALSCYSYGQSSTQVALVSHSTIDVEYTGQENYIAYLNKRGLSKDNVYKDYYTDKFTFNVGKVKAGKVVEVNVPIKNASSDYVKITAVNEICDCLVAEFPSGEMSKFKPGETKSGKVKFNTKGMSGKVQRAVEIRTYTNRKEINYLVWIQAEIVK